MKRFFPFLRPYIKEITAAPLLKMTEALFELFVPVVIARLIDTGIGGGDAGYIVRQCLILAALALVGLCVSVSAQFFAARAAVGFARDLRQKTFSHILGLSYAEYDSLGLSALITRMTTDIDTMQNGVNMVLRLLLRSPFVVFGAMIMAFTVDAKSALIFTVTIPALTAAVFAVILTTIPMYRVSREKLDAVTLAVRRALGGVRVIRAFCKEDAYGEDFRRRTGELRAAGLRAGRVSALLSPVTYVVINVSVAVLIYVGAVRVSSGSLSQGSVVALYNYMGQILVELVKLANLIVLLTKTIASSRRVSATLDASSSITYPETGAEPDPSAPAVEMRNVCFAYGGAGAETLTDVSLTVNAGETLGVIGATGSGKSTLVSLIPRLYDATSGSVKLFGRDVKSYSAEALTRMTAFAPQKATLFSGTIRENLNFGSPDAAEEDVLEAVRVSQSADVVASKAAGLDEMLEEGGKNLSGGQRQRLTVARALTKKAPILILDDSASALDAKTDRDMREAIASLSPRPATVIVSQRISAVRNCDKIAVMDDGRLVACAPHGELLRTCAVYGEIYASQSGGAQV